MTEFYRAGFQLLKVRVWLLISLASAVGACWWGWDLFQTLGTRPADGGVLLPFVWRFLVGGCVAAIGLAFAFGMWLYCRRYVTSLAFDPDGDCLVIRTLFFIGTRTERVARSAIKGTSFRQGDFDNLDGVSVDAPWHALEVAGRRFHYIIDARGRWLDPDLARQVLKNG
jgi:hypothetical protein